MNPITIWWPDRKLKFDWLDFTNQGHKFWGFIDQSCLKITLEPIRTRNLGSLLMKLSQSNFSLRSPDCYLVRSYLIATVITQLRKNDIRKFCRKTRVVLSWSWHAFTNFELQEFPFTNKSERSKSDRNLQPTFLWYILVSNFGIQDYDIAISRILKNFKLLFHLKVYSIS